MRHFMSCHLFGGMGKRSSAMVRLLFRAPAILERFAVSRSGSIELQFAWEIGQAGGSCP